jgi:hypothetical protein
LGGDAETVRFAYATSSALRYGLGFAAQWLDIFVYFDEGKAEWINEVFNGRSIEAVADRFAFSFRLLLELADEARGLLDVIE